jgi:hypothetical protein
MHNRCGHNVVFARVSRNPIPPHRLRSLGKHVRRHLDIAMDNVKDFQGPTSST